MDKKPLIVIADNNETDRMLIKLVMDEIGLDARTEEYDDGQKVKEFADTKCSLSLPKLIVIDLELPSLTGMDILKYLNTNPHLCRVPVIVFTSEEIDGDKRKCYQLGAVKYIAKGNSLQEYKDLVDFIKEYIYV